MRYAVVIEKLKHNYCAHVPDLPVCITTGKTYDETIVNMREAIEGYIDSCRRHGQPVPLPKTRAVELDVEFDVA